MFLFLIYIFKTSLNFYDTIDKCEYWYVLKFVGNNSKICWRILFWNFQLLD